MSFGLYLNHAGLDKARPDLVQHTIRQTINTVASQNVYDDYFKTQRQYFLRALRYEPRIATLFSLLPNNIMRGSDLRNINAEFSRRASISHEDSHPFCELFNMGLMGTTRTDPSTGDEAQFFKKPCDFEWKQGEIVRPDRFYFIHPSLHTAIREVKSQYAVNRRVLIGDGESWPKDRPVLPLVFLSHSSSDRPTVENFLPRFTANMSLLCPISAWYDVESLRAGSPILQEIENGIKESSMVLLFVSKRSLASKWVDQEWRTKHKAEVESGKIQLIPVLIDETKPEELPDFLRAKKLAILPPFADAAFDDQIHRLCGDVAFHLLNSNYFKVA